MQTISVPTEKGKKMREELIELVENARGNALWHNAPNPAEYVADMLIAHGVTIEKWIPVTERLPEENGSYLVATERGGVFITHYWVDGQRFSSRGGRTVITNWKERPLPPKKEE